MAKRANHTVRHPKLLLASMVITILIIAGFQVYWLRDNYAREKQNLDIKSNAAFRQTILRLQASKLKLEKIAMSDEAVTSVRVNTPRARVRDRTSASGKEPVITIMNLLQEKVKDSLKQNKFARDFIFSPNGDFKNLDPDSLEKMITQNVNRAVRSININNKALDSLDPELIQSLRLQKTKEKGVPGSQRITIDYNGEPGRRHPPDSVSIARLQNGKRDEVFLQTNRNGTPHQNAMFRILYDADSLSLKDSVTVREVTNAYTARLKDDKMDLGFDVSRLDTNFADSQAPNEVTLGLAQPLTYRLSLHRPAAYILGKLKLPLLFSLFLVALTVVSFLLLYRSVIRQRRLAQLKSDLVSNITHELKTPIATVGVAIEALKNFNALQDPQRTREYLDISQLELQRLGMLVDKVLKLSMFERKEMELKYETFDFRDVINEVVASLRLQLEKYHAKVEVTTEGDTNMKGDRLHLLSVVFNLLDNALKYSRDNNAAIGIDLRQEGDQLVLKVADNGIGIPQAYQQKVFDKFFRVPAGDTHNAKGHGLGLSYSAQVVRQHGGAISVESREGIGSTFTITLPQSPAS